MPENNKGMIKLVNVTPKVIWSRLYVTCRITRVYFQECKRFTKLVLVLEVARGKYSGIRLNVKFDSTHRNRRLSYLCAALGIYHHLDPDHLIGRIIKVRVAVRQHVYHGRSYVNLIVERFHSVNKINKQ